jgi:hypothetical protein
MNNNISNTSQISNEHLLLIDILNSMYNDNLRQITNITNTLNSLNNNNNQIRSLLVQILDVNSSRRNNFTERSERRNRPNNTTTNTNTNTNTITIADNNTESDRRLYRPYIFDTVMEYTIPLRSSALSRTSRNNYADTYNIDASISDLLNSFMQPVDVYPTQTQIETATRLVQYCNISRPINTQCPILMEDFNDTDMVTIIRPCGHIFNTEQLMLWFRTNCICPVCRYDIRNYNSTTSSDFFNNQH